MFTTPALALISSFLIFSILFIPIIRLNILISVLSSKSFSQSSLFPSSISTFSSLFFLPSPSLNPFYSHHPSQHSHLCSFYQVLLSILFIPIIHLNILISVLSTKSFSQSSLFPSSVSTFSFLFFLASPSLNPLYSHHPSQHSHLCSFYQVLLSILFIPIIHLNILISVLSTKSFSQSSLFPSSISTFSSLFFLASFAQLFSVSRSHFHTLEQG